MRLICWLLGHRWVDRRRTKPVLIDGNWWRSILSCRCKRCGHVVKRDMIALNRSAYALTYICGDYVETSS